MTHMGCSSLSEALVRQSLRAGMADGWGGSMCGTEFSDVMFGTPMPVDTEANLGVLPVVLTAGAVGVVGASEGFLWRAISRYTVK